MEKMMFSFGYHDVFLRKRWSFLVVEMRIWNDWGGEGGEEFLGKWK